MMVAVILGTLLAIPLVVLVTFVQLLYLESMRLRTRDLASLKFFKETLEDRLGMKTEIGMETFSIIKHTLLVMLGVLCLAWSADGAQLSGVAFWEGALTAWLVMLGASYAVPQLLYRRTSAHWLLGLLPLLRAMALIARPCVALLDFFQSLMDLTDDTSKLEEEPTSAENIEALISGRGGIRRQDCARSHDAPSQYGCHRRRCHPRRVAPTRDQRAVLAHSGLRAECRPDGRLLARARHVRTRRRGTRHT
jgi:hypothetical protein